MAKKSTTITFSAPQIIDNLLVSEAIRTGRTKSYVLNKIIEEYFTKNDIINQKLNFILKHSKHASKVPKEWLEEKSVFDLKVTLDEINASKYPSKRRYVRKHITQSIPQINTEKPKNILDINNFLG
jgi:predicted DNA-binding protein